MFGQQSVTQFGRGVGSQNWVGRTRTNLAVATSGPLCGTALTAVEVAVALRPPSAV
jgi:hypothetical protein